MNQKKLSHFNILNQMQMQATSVTCAKCGNWLTSQIYLHSDEKSYCQSCSGNKEDRRRSRGQEDFLKDLLFPCKYIKCDYILRASELDNHVNTCKHALFVCIVCKNLIKHENVFIEHMQQQHKDLIRTINLGAPIFSLSPIEPFNSFFIATYYEYKFIAHMQHMDSTLMLGIARSKDFNNADEGNQFQVQYRCYNGTQWTCEKEFIQFSELGSIPPSKQYVIIKTMPGKPIELNVTLFKVASLMKMPECSICFNMLQLEVSQCANGHNVCINCGKKINTCAICRSQGQKVVKLAYLFPTLPVVCPNFDNGCLSAITPNTIDVHTKNCAYRRVTCPLCREVVPKCKLLVHFSEQHKLKENFLYNTYSIDKVKEGSAYLRFKEDIFHCKYTLDGTGAKQTLRFDVELMFAESLAQANEYRFEVHIGEDFDSQHPSCARLVLRGLCQAQQSAEKHAEACSMAVSFNEVREQLAEPSADGNGKKKTLSFRYVIIDKHLYSVLCYAFCHLTL